MMKIASSITDSRAYAVWISVGLTGEHVGPAGPHARADRRVRRAGQRRGHERHRVGPPRLQADHEHHDRHPEDRRDHGQDPCLPQPVEQSALHDRHQAVGDGVRRGQRPGQAVGPTEARDEQHDAEGVDRDREAGEHRAGAEPQGAGAGQHGAVAGEHMPVSVGHHGRMSGAEVAPYDALLLVSFGGPERPEDVVPFLENVTRGRGIPARPARGGGGALLALRWQVADQRPQPHPARRDPRRPGGARHRPAGLLGQPELGSLPQRRRRRDAGRRREPGGVLRDQRVLVVLLVPAVPRGPRGRRGRRTARSWTSSGSTSTTRASSSRSSTPSSRPSPRRGRTRGRTAALRHPLGARCR